MSTDNDKDPTEVARVLAAWLDATEAPSSDERYVADSNGNSYRLPPLGSSARQRLDFANANLVPGNRRSEPSLTEEELGMSFSALAKLPAQRRLQIANAALAKRNIG